MRFVEFNLTNEALGPVGAKPGAPSFKDKIDAGGDKNNPLFSQDTLTLQKALKAAGANLGTFGPNKDGIDGVMGVHTRQAAAKFPEVAKKFKDVLDKSNPSSMKIGTSVVQDPDFKKKLEKIATALSVRSSDLIAIMKQESGVNPQAHNPSGATGLIQFMPDTAIALGTTTDNLYKMDGVQQLDYVYKYFKMTGVGNGTLGDLYMAVFMPKYVGADDNTVLGKSGSSGRSGKVYAQNKGLDRNKDGTITVADVKNSVQRFT